MTEKELYEGILSLGYPVAYSHFAEGNVPTPPYIVYLDQGSTNFAADGKVYWQTGEVDIELYSKKKDLEAEARIKGWLDQNKIFYNTEEYYTESEKLIQVIFMISL